MSRYIYTRPLCTYATQLIVTYIHTNRCISIYICIYQYIYTCIYTKIYTHATTLYMSTPFYTYATQLILLAEHA